MPHSGLSAQAHPLPLLLKLYPASLPPTSKKQKKAAKQESFQQNGYAKKWVKPLRQAHAEREQSIRHSKSGPSRSHSHAAAILIFLPIFLPHQMVWLPKSSKKSNSTEKSISAIGPAVRRDREIVGLYGRPCGTIGGPFTFPRTPTLHHTGSKFGHCSAIFQAAGSPAGTSGCIVTFLPAFALLYQHLHCRKGKASRPLHPIAHGIAPSATPTFLLCSLSTFLYSPLIHNFTFPSR